MIDFEQASRLILNSGRTLSVEKRKIETATGYILSVDIVSPVNVSPFRNSAMDGFATRCEWLNNCSTERPVTLPISGTFFAGDATRSAENVPHVIRIMTGAPVPDEYDTVVRFEDTSHTVDHVEFRTGSSCEANIRPAGEDFAVGETLFTAGHQISPLDIGLLASVGYDEIEVYRRPRVMVLGTGNELVPPGKKLRPGQIYNSNSYAVRAMIEPWCDDIVCPTAATDSLSTLTDYLDLPDFDLIITSGGVSAGDRDYVIKAAERCGWETGFHKVSIKPGKPVYFARRVSQRLIGLPGNPLSTVVTCAVFVVPLLKKMAGITDYELHRRPATLAPGQRRKGDRLLIWPGSFSEESGKIEAKYSEKKSSAALSALKGTDGLIFQEPSEDDSDLATGVTIVEWEQILTTWGRNTIPVR